jgi:glucokinase
MAASRDDLRVSNDESNIRQSSSLGDSTFDIRHLILALDYGGTKHTAGVLAIGTHDWLAHERVYSPSGADARYDQATVIKLAHDLLTCTEGELVAIGVSFGGPVDSTKGMVRLSHHVPGWEDAPLRDQLQAEFGVPAAVDNDANVAALGEWRFGAGQGCASLLYVTVSTGIGGGWVLNGQVYGGADGMAGEIGHVVVRPDGAECVCGKRGCLEVEACGRAIARKMRERRASGRHPYAAEPITGESVARAAQQDDPLAQEVMDDVARMLGVGLGGAINLMNPQRIVLGGGVTKSGERWWRTVRETARYHALPQMRVDIQPAALGDDAPLWGAVALAEPLL